ncbi:D-alanyl-D-alanine carboxypeptidase/D-alanyl-D-alanine endopeptidase [Phycisphaera mikurensis]|uniref:D-alanyl-D-alanine carboxypeptidase n=1 Tax=Phycisphaera mikurensis (strain NBRC 102666 / KCTC 22515 / FYK2301M01) TaxID=1142394 RepID=I0IDX8_PHYMF|nr:D-alanyl-D-alanine carboxypeptidase/D-alanyl-D-alanine-endopeptidase [Phycisphaera mikurensis]MBB6441273.1 D-alanyl-D-alanine carboxypeptidase/D-alanyl-D-alanine-endopeptidase (penicillin-binding protein 4) [Phycisphaera mikurensis]BAM03466.1 D-alanyl-D-alanine carboxypeptidase [Phycisphaera mikurensis NBRC 102666]
MIRLAAALAALVAGNASGELQREVRELIASAALGDAVAGVVVAELTPGGSEVRVDLNGDLALGPASNMKLVTTAAALDLLGEGFAFETTLSLLPAGDRAPSLLVRGSGDPGFGDPPLLEAAGETPAGVVARWVEAVRATGRTRFATLRMDDAIFDAQRVHPDWPADQQAYWYCAEVAGINFNDNCIDVRREPGPEPGAPAVLHFFPSFPGLAAQATNETVTGESDTFDFSRPADRNAFSFTGVVDGPGLDYAAVHDPALFFGRHLAHELAEAGVGVGEVVRGGAPAGVVPESLGVVRTTLAGVLDRTNRNSQNLFAEALLKRMGREAAGEPGSFANGSAAVRSYLARVLPEADLSGVVVADGSGLARTNRLTARLLVGLLDRVTRLPPAEARTYRESLAELGRSGTLRHRGEGVRTARVFAKTGTISGVSALSGYLVTPATEEAAERVHAFSMLFNGFAPPVSTRDVRRVQDEVLALLDRRLAPAATPAESP